MLNCILIYISYSQRGGIFMSREYIEPTNASSLITSKYKNHLNELIKKGVYKELYARQMITQAQLNYLLNL